VSSEDFTQAQRLKLTQERFAARLKRKLYRARRYRRQYDRRTP
jgi:hypothetical protein